MKTQLKGLTAAVLLMLASQTAIANESYFGVGVGTSSIDFSVSYLGNTGTIDDGSPFTIFGGSRNGNMGYEGILSYSENDILVNGNSTGESFDFLSLVFSGVGYIPLQDSFDLFGKIGFNLWNLGASSTFETDSGIALFYGFGVNVDISDSFGIRAEYQNHGDFDSGSSDLTTTTISAVFNY